MTSFWNISQYDPPFGTARFQALCAFALLLWLMGCTPPENPDTGNTLYTKMPSSYTSVDFQNVLTYDREFNIYTYRNFYNGGGVGIGDLNQDGLPDLYFTANMSPNALYLNRGDFRFEDVTEKTGVGGTRSWSTGVSIADVNGDGWLDIYVCNSGDIEGDNKQNELYINQGNPGPDGIPAFKEEAAAYGLADRGFSTHAAFFDYDKDGDLDLYLLNNSFRAIGSFDLRKNERLKRDSVGGDKLFRNDGATFTDVSEDAGIYGSVIGFGLGVTVGDVNQDGWQDIYVSNDFFERDYLYLNKGDGTFDEVLEEQMRCLSAASMGADMADINNDGHPDIFVTDMLPEPDDRIKQVTTFEDWNKYQANLRTDYYHQFTRNMLHLNNADGTFSEVGRLVGVEATDWSWGALIFDMDNDGLRDLYVANGIYQDLTDMDYLNFIADNETKRTIITKEGVNFKTLIDSIPVRPVPNYAFHNEGLSGNVGRIPKFTNKADEWGLGGNTHSNGSAYADLDNDGDMDLVVNNVNSEAFVYRNETNVMHPGRRSVMLDLKGAGNNTYAIGTRVYLYHGDNLWYAEHMPMRGFQSSMDYRMHIGVGDLAKMDSIRVIWPVGSATADNQLTVTTLKDVPTGEVIALDQKEAGRRNSTNNPKAPGSPIFTAVEGNSVDFVHDENEFADWNRDRLIYHMLSSEGPRISKGDVNGDGREDLYIGGAKDQAGRLYIQTSSGAFRHAPQEIFERDKVCEDLESVFFDADGDGDQDLYVASGGNEYPGAASALGDRLYFNDGNGGLTRNQGLFPPGRLVSSSCVEAADYDGDGDIDLFVGSRLRPFLYGVPVDGIILQNDGKGNFTDVTPTVASSLKELGMITDASWTDYDGDKDLDLVVVGEWMQVEVFENTGSSFKRATIQAGLENTQGWWTRIIPVDPDQDGDMDFILGNHGLNSRFRASEDKPLVMYVNDFDQNGRAEQILCRYENGKLLPFARKNEIEMQLPHLKKKYLRFDAYVGKSIQDLFPKEILDRSVVLEARQLASCIAVNQGNGTFELKPLPIEAQYAPVYGIASGDFDGDEREDLLLGGNFFRAKPEVGRYDASYGLFLKGNGGLGFEAVATSASGFFIEGEARDLLEVDMGGRKTVLVARNNDALQAFTY